MLRKIVIVGGKRSFIGKALTKRLGAASQQVVATSSAPHDASPVNITDLTALRRACQDATHIVNVVGVLYGSQTTFDHIHHLGARNVAQVAKETGAHLVSISAIGADAASAIPYFQSKGLGEEAIQQLCPKHALIVRPSIVFGPGDSFFNRLNTLTRYMPIAPVFGGGLSKFQPVFVDDVAQLITNAVLNSAPTQPTRILEIGGPQVLTYREMMQTLLDVKGRYRPIVSLPYSIANLQAAVLERLPPSILTITRDQIRQLQMDNTCQNEAAYTAALDLLGKKQQDLVSVARGLRTYL